VMAMDVRYLALGMVFIFFGIGGLLYFHGMAIVQPEQGAVDAASAKSLTLLGLYMGMACLVVGAIGGTLIGHSVSFRVGVFPGDLMSESLGTKYCRYCGTENRDDAYFCEKCGKRISIQ